MLATVQERLEEPAPQLNATPLIDIDFDGSTCRNDQPVSLESAAERNDVRRAGLIGNERFL